MFLLARLVGNARLEQVRSRAIDARIQVAEAIEIKPVRTITRTCLANSVLIGLVILEVVRHFVYDDWNAGWATSVGNDWAVFLFRRRRNCMNAFRQRHTEQCEREGR